MPLYGLGLARVRSARRRGRRAIALRLVIALAVVATGAFLPALPTAPYRLHAAPASQAGGPAETIFQTKCAACHTIGKGKLVGPDLQDVTARRDAQWLKRFIHDPNQMFAANDPTAQQLLAESNNVKMPALGLTDAEIDALLAFLAAGSSAAAGGGAAAGAQAQPAPQAGAAASAPAAVGDPAAGLRAFTGEARLAGGGPACIGCHSVDGLAGLGGGALGPDLTHAAARYPGPALTSVLGNIAFPTMVGPFANRPLTPQEQADLAAYLGAADQAQAATAPPVAPGALTRNTGVVLAVGLAGAVALTLLLAVFWPRQRQSVSARLRNRPVVR